MRGFVAEVAWCGGVDGVILCPPQSIQGLPPVSTHHYRCKATLWSAPSSLSQNGRHCTEAIVARWELPVLSLGIGKLGGSNNDTWSSAHSPQVMAATSRLLRDEASRARAAGPIENTHTLRGRCCDHTQLELKHRVLLFWAIRPQQSGGRFGCWSGLRLPSRFFTFDVVGKAIGSVGEMLVGRKLIR